MGNKYDDIINMKYPFVKKNDNINEKHPRMKISDRAKIFASFAALRGYDAAIKARQKITIPKCELSEDKIEYLDKKILEIEKLTKNGKHPIISIIYYNRNKLDDEGEYIKFTGMTVGIDRYARLIQVVDKKIDFMSIYDIELEEDME